MMKKKVKKIPKYYNGELAVGMPDMSNYKIQNRLGVAPPSSSSTISYSGNENWADMTSNQKSAAVANAIGGGADLINMATSGQNVTAGTALGGIAKGASAGATFGPIGAGIGAAVGLIAGTAGRKHGYDKNSTSTNFNDIYQEGSGWLSWFGPSKHEAKVDANRVQSSNIAKIQTEVTKADYMNNPNVQVQPILAAEGGIMRKPVDALVSKGELIYDPTTKKLRQVPGSKGKPNKADDVYAKLYEGDVVISNSPTMLMANGKTPAQNLMGMVDKYATGGTVKAREAIIKKVVNWQEANKTKPQEYAKFDDGGIAGINKYGYNKNMSDFAYWDKDKNEYKKEYLDWVNNLTEQDVRDIESGKYGDMSEYFSKNKGKKLDVATAQKLMTDKKYGNWHKIGQAVVDNKIKNTEPKLAEPWQAKMSINGVGPLWQDMYKSNYPIDYTVTPIDMKLKTLPNPSAADGSRAARKYLSKQNTPNWLDEMSNLLPVIGGLFDKYDWHTESSQITPPLFVPVNADPRPLLRAADESSSIGNYNLANMGVGTGAYLAHSTQLASDRAKRYADAYKWQQETNNKLIAQNAGIYNDWRKQRDAYATQAIADTRANEGAAQQMKDQARKDRLEFYYGKRNDDMLTAMLEPMFEYGTPDKAYRQIYKRRIV